jgi:CRP-like cAMP-binding protein
MTTPDESLFHRFGKEFPRGTVLFREGDPGTEMFVVHRGQVRISIDAAGKETILSTLGPGEFFGEMAILSGKPRSATATCVEETKLVVVDARTFEAMLRANGEIAARMIRKLAERLEQANDRIENLLLPEPTMRVAHFLASLAEREPRGIRLPVSTDELPGRLSLEPRVVREILDRLARSRVLIPLDGGVAVPDPARLRQFLDFLQMKAQFGDRG